MGVPPPTYTVSAERTDSEERILVLGSEPQFYFYANRPAATRMAIMYPMTGPYSYAGALREEFLNDLQRDTRYVVFVSNRTSWTEFPGEVSLLLRPVSEILDRSYEVVAGMVGRTLIPASDPRIKSCPVIILRRKTG